MRRWKEVVFLTCLFARIASSQNFGPNYCLLSRLDVVPCLTVFPDTPDPGVNQYSIYQTSFIRGPAGLPICIVNSPPEGQQSIRDIDSIGVNGQVKFLVSPGIELPEPVMYGDQQLVTYNVQCPEGHIAFFNVTFADIEIPSCLGRCVDYLQVNRGEFGTSEGCGSDDAMTANNNQLELRTFTAVFRTSPTVEHRGFKATVTCFKLEDSAVPPPGCTVPSETGEAMPSDENRRRRKRDLEDFHKEWRQHLTYLKRMKRQLPGLMLRFLEINVPHQVVVNFTNKELIFIDVKTNTTTDIIENILFLHTFDKEGNVDEFRESGLDDIGRIIPFPGPGPMFVVGRHAYFQLFVIDPRGLLPNANETAVINALTEGQFDALTLETERLSDEFLMPQPPNPVDIGLPPLRRRRQTGEFPPYEDKVILLAIENENACNIVLRTNANATLESADPAVVQRLRGGGIGSGSQMIIPG